MKHNEIIQGTNKPIVLVFSEKIDFASLEVSLNDFQKELKHWSLIDIILEDNLAVCGLSQSETVLFPTGKATLEVKWKAEDGIVENADVFPFCIVNRDDKTIMED